MLRFFIVFMENNFNVSYITLDGFIELHKYKYLYFLIMFTAYILIICCNSTIVCLIVIHRNLHEPMYVFIAALLVNSLLFSTALYPKILTDVLSEKQIISYSACLFQFHIFYSLGGSEFLLLTAMSYDRYVSICKPLQYATIMRKSNISLMLLLAWILPSCQFAVSIVFTLKLIFCNNTIYKLFCVASREISVYGVFILLNVVGFPVFFIVFTYIRILIICYHSSGDVRKKAAQTCLPHLLVLTNYFCLFTFEVIAVRLEYEFPKTARLIISLQLVLYNPLFNPLIYGLKMKEISKHLNRLFCQDKGT
uniref:Olfactory receptor n=1 Tax=Anabas testudineus TaxID=64144 RepID=A0A7N6B9G6_ANATE